jgi:mono/diheme cytochrome c family protein
MRVCALVAVSALAVACTDGLFELDLERMIDQRRFRAYQPCEFFPDGRAMRTPPADTIERDHVSDPALAQGVVDGAYVDRVPLDVDRSLVSRGHDRFDTFCSPCHGIAGDADSIVAANMSVRRPPSLVDDEARSYPPGYLFRVISTGYGVMRSYAEDLTIEERWATVAYLRALQLRSGVPLAALPAALRERAEGELR